MNKRNDEEMKVIGEKGRREEEGRGRGEEKGKARLRWMREER